MRKLVVFVAFFSSFAAHAGMKAAYMPHHADFTISSIADAGDSIYFACDSVEAAAKELLENLGARNISVNCSGGLDLPMSATDAFVSADFESLSPVNSNLPTAIDANYSGVQLSGNDDCYLAKSILNGVKTDFTISSLAGTDSCASTNSSYTFALTILK